MLSTLVRDFDFLAMYICRYVLVRLRNVNYFWDIQCVFMSHLVVYTVKLADWGRQHCLAMKGCMKGRWGTNLERIEEQWRSMNGVACTSSTGVCSWLASAIIYCQMEYLTKY